MKRQRAPRRRARATTPPQTFALCLEGGPGGRVHCDRMRHHPGPHTWQLVDLQTVIETTTTIAEQATALRAWAAMKQASR